MNLYICVCMVKDEKKMIEVGKVIKEEATSLFIMMRWSKVRNYFTISISHIHTFTYLSIS